MQPPKSLAIRQFKPIHGALLVTGVESNIARSFLYAASQYFPTHTGRPWTTIKATHDRQSLKEHQSTCLAEMEKLGVELCEVDAESYADYERALRHCKVLYIVPSADPNRVNQVRQWVKAAQKASSLDLIILVSVLGVNKVDNAWTHDFRLMERILREANLPHVLLRCTPFMETLFAFADDLRNKHTLRLPMGTTGKFAPVSAEDVAHLALMLASDPTRHAGCIYDITGPECMTGERITHLAMGILERPIVYDPTCTSHETETRLLAQGLSPWLCHGMVAAFDMMREGEMEMCTPEVGADLLDRPLQTLRDFFLRYVTVFQSEKPREPGREVGRTPPSEWTTDQQAWRTVYDRIAWLRYELYRLEKEVASYLHLPVQQRLTRRQVDRALAAEHAAHPSAEGIQAPPIHIPIMTEKKPLPKASRGSYREQWYQTATPTQS